jgi:hypothetical protein
MKRNKIIIDKDAFVGISVRDLCNFAQNHFLILPLVLHDECATDAEKREELFERFRKVILSHGCICPSGRDVVKKEGQTLQPYGSLAQIYETNRMRQEFKEGYVLSTPNNVNDIHGGHIGAAQILLDLHEKVAKAITPKILEEAEEERGSLEANKLERFKLWIRAVESTDIHKIGISTFSCLMDAPEKFCLSPDWVTWHFVRVASVLALDYAFLKKGKGRKKELINAEHDVQDIEYVYLLSRADGLLTRDKKLVTPLAKTAFPDKDILSSIGQVPKEYICNWS